MILHSNSASFLFLLCMPLSSYLALLGLSFSSPVTAALTHRAHATLQHYRLSNPVSDHHCARPWQTRFSAAEKKSCILNTGSEAAKVPVSPLPVPPIAFHFQSIPRQYYLNLITHQQSSADQQVYMFRWISWQLTVCPIQIRMEARQFYLFEITFWPC